MGPPSLLLPLPARQVLQRCSAFPSAEVAVRTLTAARADTAGGTGTVPGPRRAGDDRTGGRPVSAGT